MDPPLYHRRRSTSQSDDTAALQQQSGELWGRGARPNGQPCAKAYLGALPQDVAGIEFTTEVRPHPTGHPFEARWYGATPGTQMRYIDGMEYVVVSIRVTRNTQC